MKTKSIIWYEVWAAEVSAPPYILLLWCGTDGLLEIYDPVENAVEYTTTSYEEAMYWLTEDEFTQVTGRMSEEWLEAPLTGS